MSSEHELEQVDSEEVASYEAEEAGEKGEKEGLSTKEKVAIGFGAGAAAAGLAGLFYWLHSQDEEAVSLRNKFSGIGYNTAVSTPEIRIPIEELPSFLQPDVLIQPDVPGPEERPLKGQVVVAFGGSRGIGKGLIEQVAAHGADVVTGRMNTSGKRQREMEEILDGIRARGVRAEAVYGDIRSQEVMQNYLNAVRETGADSVYIYFGPAAGAVGNDEDSEQHARQLNAETPARTVEFFQGNGVGVEGVVYPASTMSYAHPNLRMWKGYIPVARYKHEGVQRLQQKGVPVHMVVGHAVVGTDIIRWAGRLERDYPGLQNTLARTSMGGRLTTIDDMAVALTAATILKPDEPIFSMGRNQWGFAPDPDWWRQYLDYANSQFERIGFEFAESEAGEGEEWALIQ